jgi:hypothetical protein
LVIVLQNEFARNIYGFGTFVCQRVSFSAMKPPLDMKPIGMTPEEWEQFQKKEAQEKQQGIDKMNQPKRFAVPFAGSICEENDAYLPPPSKAAKVETIIGAKVVEEDPNPNTIPLGNQNIAKAMLKSKTFSHEEEDEQRNEMIQILDEMSGKMVYGVL